MPTNPLIIGKEVLAQFLFSYRLTFMAGLLLAMVKHLHNVA